MISTGTPTMKLNNKNFAKQGKKSGNATAIINEAFLDENKERACNDSDYKPELTASNIHLDGLETAEEINDFVQSKAEAYAKEYQETKGKKMRSDATIAVAGIIKPDIESMGNMSRDEQIDYLKAHYEEIKNVCENRGFEMIAATIHVDEGNPHVHYVMYDPEYKVGSKLKLSMFSEFNKEVPKRLQAKGFEVKILEGYDIEKAKDMSEEELEEYKISFKAKRKKFNQSAKTYKQEQEKQKLEKEVSAKKADARKVLEIRKDLDEQVAKQKETLKTQRGFIEKRQEYIDRINAKIKALEKKEKQLADRESRLNDAEASQNHRSEVLDEKESDYMARLKKLQENETELNGLINTIKTGKQASIDDYIAFVYSTTKNNKENIKNWLTNSKRAYLSQDGVYTEKTITERRMAYQDFNSSTKSKENGLEL